MVKFLKFAAAVSLVAQLSASGPAYNKDGELKFPAAYRQWVFLSSGVGMTYGPAAAMGQDRAPLFDNVYVNPEAYRSFLATGKWPEKTMFILEIRNSESHASINNGGHFQRDVVAIEAHVKDFAGGTGPWTFYGFPVSALTTSVAAKPVPRTASCYTCHSKNAAVENTFVQFYPELYDVAVRKGTLNSGFQKLPITSTHLGELLGQSWAKAEAALVETRTFAPDANAVSEASLRTMGDRLLQAKQPALAVKLLEWATGQYPKSASLQDSLAAARRALN